MTNSIVYIFCCNFLFKVLDFVFIKYIKTLVLHPKIWIMRFGRWFLLYHHPYFQETKKGKNGSPAFAFSLSNFLKKSCLNEFHLYHQIIPLLKWSSPLPGKFFLLSSVVPEPS